MADTASAPQTAQKVDPSIFTFRTLQVTETVNLGAGAGEELSLFGEVFQRDKAEGVVPRRICSGRIRLKLGTRGDGPAGQFRFAPEEEVQPFMETMCTLSSKAFVDMRDMLRSGADVQLVFKQAENTFLNDAISAEKDDPSAAGGWRELQSISISVTR
ncbi:MAG: hypothetical protein AAF719_08070 [Pseudomonadota bacterium]